MRCDWCNAEAVGVVEVQPALHRTITHTNPQTGERTSAKVISKFAINANACSEHAAMVAGPQPPSPDVLRRKRRKRGEDQTTIFDVPGVTGPDSAIHGDAA